MVLVKGNGNMQFDWQLPWYYPKTSSIETVDCLLSPEALVPRVSQSDCDKRCD